MNSDINQKTLRDWVFSQVRAFSLAEAATLGLKVDASKLTRDFTTRIGIALRKLGCEKVEKRNDITRFWYQPPARNGAASTFVLDEPPMHGQITREQKALINRQAHKLAQAYVAYQHQLTVWAIEQQQAGNNVDEDTINAAVPDITDLMRGQ